MVIAVAGTVAVANMSLAAERVSASVAAVMWPSFRSPLLKFVSLSSYFRIDVSLYLFLSLSLSPLPLMLSLHVLFFKNLSLSFILSLFLSLVLCLYQPLFCFGWLLVCCFICLFVYLSRLLPVKTSGKQPRSTC